MTLTVKHEVFQAIFTENTDPITFLDASLPKTDGQTIYLCFVLGKGNGPAVVGFLPGRPAVEAYGIAVDEIVKGIVMKCHYFILFD